MEISVSAIYKNYKNFTALSDISFEVKTGIVLGVLGVNGAGKTTLLRILTGIIQPSSGTVTLDNHVLNSDLILKHIGYLPEERGLYKNMSAMDCIVFLASLKGVSSKDSKAYVKRKIDDLEIDFDLNKPVGSFSKGMQQKVQLLTATVHNPKILILDEPFSGLDPLNSQVIKKEIMSLSAQGSTILMSTHRMDTFEDLCNSYLFLRKGKILAKGSKQDLSSHQNKLRIMLKGTLNLQDVEVISSKVWGEYTEYIIMTKTPTNDILKELIEKNQHVISINPHTETLEDVFIKMNRNTENEQD